MMGAAAVNESHFDLHLHTLQMAKGRIFIYLKTPQAQLNFHYQCLLLNLYLRLVNILHKQFSHETPNAIHTSTSRCQAPPSIQMQLQKQAIDHSFIH